MGSFGKEAGQGDDVVCWSLVEDEVGGVVPLAGGASPVEFDREGVGSGAVDGFAVLFQPRAHFLEEAYAFGRDAAIGHGPDVEQVVAASADGVDELVDEQRAAFPALVGGGVAPSAVEGLAGLPVASYACGGHVLFGGGVVALPMWGGFDAAL